jgi:signal transduction histidine kinase
MDEKGHSELDVKAGLETISSSSRNLIKFVETYRQLSGVARPVRKAIMVEELINKVFALGKEMTPEGVTCRFMAQDPDLMIYADEGQISQILINLVKNAVQAGASEITNTGSMGKEDEVILNVANNGQPISPESQEQIFVPFFTTKKKGSGIGLSISRQIMRNHNGSIELTRSDSTATVFTLIFR